MDFKTFVKNEFLKRTSNNPQYSLRDYAKTLKVDHSSLSQLMRGRRKFTREMILRISESLNIEPNIRDNFLLNLNTADKSKKFYDELSLDTFSVIAEWFHYALFELVTTRDFDPRPSAIAHRLNITEEQAQTALDRLKRLGLLRERVDKKIVQTKNLITTVGMPFTGQAFKLLHKGLMEKSMKALDEVPLDIRDHSTMTMAINADQISEAKLRIKNFRRSLCEDLQTNTDRNAVYQLAINFFPISKISENNK